MSRGPYYSTEDDALLISIIEDMPGAKYIDMARKAQRYGICKNRDMKALASRISKLANPVPSEPDATLSEEDLWITILEKRLADVSEKYDRFVWAALHGATLWSPDQKGVSSDKVGLKLDIKAIWDFLYKYELEGINARFESLKEEAE